MGNTTEQQRKEQANAEVDMQKMRLRVDTLSRKLGTLESKLADSEVRIKSQEVRLTRRLEQMERQARSQRGRWIERLIYWSVIMGLIVAITVTVASLT